MAKTYMIGNWKMNQSLEEINSFYTELKSIDLPEGNFWISPQFIHIGKCLRHSNETQFKVGAQNTSNHDSGAYTGEISAKSLKDFGAHFAILGHSERRAYYAESDELINSKVSKVLESGLVPVLCIGETLEERESNKTLDIVLGQIKAGLKDIKINSADELILAYEPVWAIGTGKTASPEQAEEVHAAIRNLLKELYGDLGTDLSILYGGSVKPANVKELLAQPNINGGLVGGASIKADSFADLCKA